MHAFRFGIRTTRSRSGAAWLAKARRIEALGYDVLVLPDHMIDAYAPGPALAAAAAATTRLRLGALVFANDFRSPVMLAKEAATLDVISNGRTEFGIGAGWRPADYRQLGIAYGEPKVRVARMKEAVRLIRECWTTEAFDREGRYYRVRNVNVLPKPVQRPHPPIVIGAGGPTMLRFAAREADVVALVPQFSRRGRPDPRHITARATARKVRVVREAAPARDPELNIWVFDAGPHPLRAAATAWLDSPYLLYGSREALVHRLLRYREELGITYYAIPEPAMEAFAPVLRDLKGR